MKELRLSEWIDNRQRAGSYCFDGVTLGPELGLSDETLRKSLGRFQRRRRIRRIRKGFYIILPVEYANIGMIPADWFVDDMMSYLGLPYYVGLLTAAGLHGAAHQQAQEYQVVIDRYERPIRLPGLSIRFFYKKRTEETPRQEIRGHGGMLPVATPEATAFDLVHYANRIGGLDAVTTVLAELVELLNPAKLVECAGTETAAAVVQRLGWLLENLQQKNLADALHEKLMRGGNKLPKTALDPAGDRAGTCLNRWNIVENFQPEADQ